MNWTGGQLHRSAHQGTLSKTQRQNFAKSRQLAIDRVSRHPSPIRGFPSLGKRGEQVACKDNQKEQAVVAEEQTQDASLAGSQLPQSLPGNSSSQLDLLKYRLLQEPDWAAVSAARPLAITFAPVEETERFGKRRKLNDKDRKRLSAAYGSQSLPGLLKSRETEALWNGDLDRVKIRINGRPVGMHSSESPGVSASGLSSQSMLLDNEESTSSHRLGMAKDPWTQGPNRLSLQPSFGRAPPKFGSPLSPFPHTTAYEDLGSIQRKLTLVPGRRESANTSMEHHRPMISERSVTRSPSALDSPLPTRQHFTIDHQAFAEETGMLQKYVRQPSHEPPRSLMGTLGASPELLNTDALPDSPASSWLTQPQPQRLDASSNSNACRSRAAILTAANESSRSNFPRNPFIDMAESDHCSPTAKVFGQLVQIRSDCGADYE